MRCGGRRLVGIPRGDRQGLYRRGAAPAVSVPTQPLPGRPSAQPIPPGRTLPPTPRRAPCLHDKGRQVAAQLRAPLHAPELAVAALGGGGHQGVDVRGGGCSQGLGRDGEGRCTQAGAGSGERALCGRCEGGAPANSASVPPSDRLRLTPQLGLALHLGKGVHAAARQKVEPGEGAGLAALGEKIGTHQPRPCPGPLPSAQLVLGTRCTHCLALCTRNQSPGPGTSPCAHGARAHLAMVPPDTPPLEPITALSTRAGCLP